MNWYDLGPELPRVEFQANNVTPPQDLLANALAHPAGLLPLDQMLVAGDQVAIAVNCLEPHVLEALQHTLNWLDKNGVAQSQLAVVTASWMATEEQQSRAKNLAEQFPQVHWVEHDPDDSYACSYLAATVAGDPIYLSRTLTDADVVISVTAARCYSPESSPLSVCFELLPCFTNRDTWKRIVTTYGASDAKLAELHAELAEADQWLGTAYRIEALADNRGMLGGVVAGSRPQIQTSIEHELATRWQATGAAPQPPFAWLALTDTAPEPLPWSTWLWLIQDAIRLVDQGGIIALAADMPEIPLLESTPDTATDWYRHWCREELERLTLDHSVWIVGPQPATLTNETGWHWVESIQDLSRLTSQADRGRIVPLSWGLSGALQLETLQDTN